MDYNNEKLTAMAKPRSEAAKERARKRMESEDLSYSQEIALLLHYYLRIMNLTQAQFAESLNVSAMYVSKLMKGNENLTLETIAKFERVLGHSLISIPTPYEGKYLVPLTPNYNVGNMIPSKKYQDVGGVDMSGYRRLNSTVA